MSELRLSGIHHVAYRCKDAKQTVAFYQRFLNMEFQLAISENEVPSTKDPHPYMHVFLDAGKGNVLAFFELPHQAPMEKDHNTPEWVQHIAFKIDSLEMLLQTKHQLEQANIEVLGPIDHTIFTSIYFFDPNGHRLELAVNTATTEMLTELKRVAPAMLEEWSRTKQAPKHADWLHK
jgi:catechol 2,3-dioxygenase-like lactoylglutathione lyase family enzyme